MRPGRLLAPIAAGVAAVIGLAVAFPGPMVSPGALMRGHADLEADCFACHAPWRGAQSQRCVRCHRPADIGLRTTRGVARSVPPGQPGPKVSLQASFHQQLIEQDCMACHSDHEGPKRTERSRKPFSHALLRPSARPLCGGCHGAPSDRTHVDLTVGCSRCHTTNAWKPATFDHAALQSIEQQRCEGCHRPPADALHRSVTGSCPLCHSQKQWKPSTFDHNTHFVLDADHNAPCATCHVGEEYRRVTCYGCHAHRPDRIGSIHREEGIRDFDHCVRCHRDPGAQPEGSDARERD